MLCSDHRFIQYNATSLEKNYKYELLAEHDLGITIDLINPQAYAKEKDANLDPADERLLEEDTHHAPQDAKRHVPFFCPFLLSKFLFLLSIEKHNMPRMFLG